MNNIYLLIGGNLGDRLKNLTATLNALEMAFGKVLKQSKAYQTAAWGNTNQPDFLNQALMFETSLSAFEVLDIIQDIENSLGRKREEKWGARTMDIDLIYFDDAIINEDRLTVPHPFIAQRRFVLIPLADIAADFVHPILKLTTLQMLECCEDDLEVRVIVE